MLNPTDTKVDLIVNKLTESQFDELSASGRLDQNQLWIVTDEPYMVLGQGGSGASIRDFCVEEVPPAWTVPDNLTFVALQDNSTVSMSSESGPRVSLEYSTDNGQTWNTFTVGSTTVTLAHKDDMVQFRATSTNSAFAQSYNGSNNYFTGTGSLEVAGDLRTIYDKDNWQSLTTTSSYGLQGLFKNFTALKDAHYLNLGFTSFTNTNSTGHLFDGCYNLTRGPYIKALSIGSSWNLEYLFYNCTSLQEITLEMDSSTATWNSSSFQRWVYGVPTGGTIYTNRVSPGDSGDSYFPSHWTVKSLSLRP